jgi:hypothetical protein
MALSTVQAFLTGKAIAVTASVALAGGGLAAATTVTENADAATDGLEIAAAAGDDRRDDGANGEDGRAIAQEAQADALADVTLPERIDRDELVPTVATEDAAAPDESAGDDGDHGRSADVHAALAGDLTPADGAAFGAAVADGARAGAAVGRSVAEAARGDAGPRDTPAGTEETPAADARAAGEERAAEARAAADDTDDAADEDIKPALPDAAADQGRNASSTD